MRVGAAACPARFVTAFELQKSTQGLTELSKGFPWRVELRAANRNKYDCRWQSYINCAGSPQGLTDEVEAIDHHHKLVRRCYLRPHPSRAEARDTFPWRGRLWPVRIGSPYRPSSVCPDGQPPSPRGRLFLCSGGLLRRFITSSHCNLACRRPYIQNQTFSRLFPSFCRLHICRKTDRIEKNENTKDE